MLKFISQKLATGKRYEDLAILRKLISTRTPIELSPDNEGDARKWEAVANMLSGKYSTVGENLIEVDSQKWSLDHRFEQALGNPAFLDQVVQAIDFGLARNAKYYSNKYANTDFVLNAKYTREEVCRLLRWSKEPNYQNIGGYFHDKETNTFPVFINYDKDPSISITTQYEDRFINDRELVAISKSKRTLSSPEIVNLKNAATNGMRCYLFVRKNTKDKDDGTEFYFLGRMRPTGQFRQFVMKDSTASAVEITYELDNPVRPDLYDYFLSDFSSTE